MSDENAKTADSALPARPALAAAPAADPIDDGHARRLMDALADNRPLTDAERSMLLGLVMQRDQADAGLLQIITDLRARLASPAPVVGAGVLASDEDLYLVHAGGDAYQAEIVPASRLDDAYLLTQWCRLDDIDPERRREALEHFHDEDQWTHEHLTGHGARVKFSVDFEDGWVEVVRLPRAAFVTPASQAGAGVPAGWALVPVELLADAAHSVEGYRAGCDFDSADRKLIGRLKMAIRSASQPPAQAEALVSPARLPMPPLPNRGHGHVFPRPDGMLTKCGGPSICAECSRDLALKNAPVRHAAPAAPADTMPDEAALARLRENGAKAWADVPNAGAWVEWIRGAAPGTAVAAGATEDRWTVIAPDGQQYHGPSAHQAANAATRARRTPEEQAVVDAELARMHAQQEAEDAAMWEHLNCPACGGSGHIEGAQHIAAIRASGAGGDAKVLEALQEALSVCSSVRTGNDRRVIVGDDIMYAQTAEWCKWAEHDVGPKVSAAIDAARARAEKGE